MRSNIPWRLLLLFATTTLLVLVGVLLFFDSGACLNNAVCDRDLLILAVVATAVATLGITLYFHYRNRRHLQRLTNVIQTVAQGDLGARILLPPDEQWRDATRALNTMLEDVRSQIESLREENHQFTTLLYTIGSGVIIIDKSGTVRLINPAACRLLETTQKRALGRSFAEVVRHHQFIELWQTCRDGGEEQVKAVEIGRDKFLQMAVTPFREEKSLGYLVILQDLTQVRHLQTVRRDFISNISHELRTPLASLRAVVETLQDGALEDPPAAQRFLSRAANEIDVLTQMVEELLELSRIESGQVPFKFQATAVSDLLLTPLDRIRPQALRANIELILDAEPQLPKVLADQERVSRVISNLLHNAIKFTPEGGTIAIRAYRDAKRFPGEVVISVKDTGVGIATEDLPRIFERFYKSDRARTRSRQGGTGLGLAISRHIVQGHNGRIGVDSKEGKGSTFYFTLPIA